jgi:hypothetical protein
MKRPGLIVLVALLLAPALSVPAEAGWRGGRGVHAHRHFPPGPARFHRGAHVGAGLAFGIGVGALLTAPWWYPSRVYPYYYPSYAYPYPVYPYPAYPHPAYPPAADPGYSYGPPAGAPPPDWGAPPSSPTTPTPELLTPSPAQPAPAPRGQVPPGASGAQVSTAGCQVVAFPGGYQTEGSVTAWVPPHTRVVCP